MEKVSCRAKQYLSWKVLTIVEQKKYVEVGNKTELFNAMHILRIFVKKLAIYD